MNYIIYRAQLRIRKSDTLTLTGTYRLEGNLRSCCAIRFVIELTRYKEPPTLGPESGPTVGSSFTPHFREHHKNEEMEQTQVSQYTTEQGNRTVRVVWIIRFILAGNGTTGRTLAKWLPVTVLRARLAGRNSRKIKRPGRAK